MRTVRPPGAHSAMELINLYNSDGALRHGFNTDRGAGADL